MSTVPHSSAALLQRYRRNISADVRTLLGIAKRCVPYILLAPLLLVGLIFLSMRSPWFSLAQKDFQEILAPSLLATAFLVSLTVQLRYRLPYLRWQTLLLAALFCRELHFWGTNNGIYIALILLFWYLARHVAEFGPFVCSRRIATLLFGSMWAYFIAKTFDRGYWRKFFPEIAPYRDALEESTESLGHLLLLLMAIASWRVAAQFVNTSPKAMADGDTKKRSWFLWPGLILIGGTATVLSAGIMLRSPARDKPEPTPGQLPFELSSVCRVADGLFLISSDEQRNLFLCRIDAAGKATLVSELELKLADDSGKLALDDIEELARDDAGRFYAVTSHRQLSDAKDARRRKRNHGTERALVSFRLTQSDGMYRISDARVVSRDLLDRIRASKFFPSINWHHSKTFHWRRLATNWQIDLEGMACCDGILYLGFKNPVENGRAAILGYDPASQKLTVIARPNFGGHGILSLCYDRDHDRLLVLTNDPLRDRYDDSCLWIATRSRPGQPWKFAEQPHHIFKNEIEGHRKASGIAVDGNRVILCFDDASQGIVRAYAVDLLQD